MNIYEHKAGVYDYKYLPEFASYLLNDHFLEFVTDQLHVSRQVNLPLLKHLSHLKDEQIIEFGKQSSREYLENLANNLAKFQIQDSITRWLQDKLSIVGKFDITAEDITAVNYVRGKVFKNWVQNYDILPDEKFALLDEIDSFLFGSVTTAMNNFIDLLKKKIEEDAHFNEQLISTSPGIIFIFDIQKGKEVYVNGNVLEVMGYSKEEILAMDGNILSILTHPDDLSDLQKHLELIMLDKIGKPHVLEYRFRHKAGTYKWLRAYNVIFKRDLQGNPLEVLGTSFEITNERETALALETREAQLLEAQGLAQIGSFEWDLVNDYIENTPQLLNIFEFETHQAVQEFIQKVHPQDKEKVENAIAQSFITGNYDCQYRFIAKRQEKVLWTRGRVLFHEGKPVRMHATVQDISHLKQIEDELLKKTKQLERSNESLHQFASIASHDLKEPLRKMSMYTDMVITREGKNLTEQSYTNLEKVKSSSIRMQNMIEDILNFSTLTNEQKRENIELTTILAEVKLILEESINEKDALVECDALPNLSVIPSQMRQLFQNLISNALKFSHKNEKPVIRVTHEFLTKIDLNTEELEPAARYIRIFFSDNGIGFKQEHAEKIFNLFTRLHGRSSYEGSGLGLSICKRIVENHGGIISARSTHGKGATFIITLPLEY